MDAFDQYWNHKRFQHGDYRERRFKCQPRGESTATEIMPMWLGNVFIRMGWIQISGQAQDRQCLIKPGTLNRMGAPDRIEHGMGDKQIGEKRHEKCARQISPAFAPMLPHGISISRPVDLFKNP